MSIRMPGWSVRCALAAACAMALGFEDVRGPSPSFAWSQPPDDPARAAAMREHFADAMRVHEAVVRGDLNAARAHARLLAERAGPARFPAASRAHADTIVREASRAATAPDLVVAASATAAILVACGDCHQAADASPAVRRPAQAPEGGLVGHMHQHQRAVDLMLQGLMVPSTPLWREGAEGFRSSPLQPRDLPRDPMLARDIVQAEERAHRLASQAVQAYDSAARAGFYAQILAQCAECHQSGGGEWGPKPR